MKGVLLDPISGRPEEDFAPDGGPALVGIRAVEGLAESYERDWKYRIGKMVADGELQAAGTQYVSDLKPPFAADDFPQITLSTASLMLWPSATWTPVFTTDWWTGRRMRMELWGKISTILTPGNLTVEVRLGTADAGGTILATSAATALAASKTNILWHMDVMVRCRDTNTTVGSNGSLIATAIFEYDGAGGLFTTTSQNPLGLPASAPAATAVDLIGNSGINVQMKRSGSSVEVCTVTDLAFQHLN